MKFLDLLKNSDPEYRKNFWYFFCAYFLVLLNYPLIRASSTTMFFESFGAKSSPVAWLWTVLFLSIAIYSCNKLQSWYSIQKVFLFSSLFSAGVFALNLLGLSLGFKELSWTSFIWKEIYIVIQVHFLLGYANNYFKQEDFKLMVGPMGAFGSIGGIIGGLLTSHMSSITGTSGVMVLGIFFVIIPALLFWFTPSLLKIDQKHPESPVHTLDTPDIRRYVFFVASLVTLSQFVINIADFKFNLLFEKEIIDSAARTSYLGHVFTITNLVTFILQFAFLPLILPRVSERNYHLFIPISYILVGAGLFFSNLGGILPIAALFIYLKASDYSFFVSGKEILYQPLNQAQKYGAKYLTDMLVYRVAKALIAAVLIYLQSSFILNMMMGIFLILWIVLVTQLFRLHRRLFSY
ncbi:MAG: hypothetical protein AB7I27_03680 [Bacteriovoracaceae bacterium]